MRKSLMSLAVALAMASSLLASSVLTVDPEPVSGATAPRFRDFVGVNSGDRSSTVSDIAQAVGWVRDYHRWYWFETANDSYSFHTLDSWYGALKRAGLGVLVTVEFCPSWSSSNGTTMGNPYSTGDGTQPAHYAEHAEYMAQIAARWGRTKYSSSDSRIEGPDKKTGLGYVDFLESYNEPDYWWWNPTFPAYKYAQMLQADYSGYQVPTSSTRPLIGAKKADPTIGIVHGGVLGADTAYLENIVKNLGPGQMSFDAVNFHIMMGDTPSIGGKSPEAGPFVSSINQVKAWRDQRAPGRPIWITEIGWDTYTDGRTRSKIWAPETSAANYLLRALAIGMANGVDKMFIYMYKDPARNSTTQYSSMGLVEYDAGYDGPKKAGWYYLATARSVLGEYVLERIERNGDGNPAVYSYLFTRPDTGEKVSMIWARNPNSDRDDGTTLGSYRLYTPWAQIATLIEPAKGNAQGLRSALQVGGMGTSSAYVTLPRIGEKPLFVYYRPKGATSPTQPPATTGNLLANPSFESDSDGDGLPDGWVIPSWAQSSTSRSGGSAHDGGYSILFQSSSGPSYTVYQDVPVQGGATYDFSGWAFIPYSNGNFNFVLQLLSYSSNNGTLSTYNLGEPFTATTGGWVQVKSSVAMPSNAVKARLQMKVSTLRASIHVDDLSLVDSAFVPPTPTPTPIPAATSTPTATPTPSPTPTKGTTSTPTSTPLATATPTSSADPVPYVNLLTNPGMEEDANGDGEPDEWWVPSWQLNHVGLATEQSHSGQRSLRHRSHSDRDSYVVQQDIPVEPGRTYDVRGWVNIPELASPARFSLQVQTLNRWNGVVYGPNPLMGNAYTGPTSGWELIEGSITIPSNAEKARVLMKVENLNGTVYMDDLEFVRANAMPPGPTNTPTAQLPTATPTSTSVIPANTPTATPTETTVPPAIPTPTATSARGQAGLLANSSFEQDADGNGIPDQWYVPPWLSSLVARDGSDAHEGGHSLRLASTGGQNVTVRQDVPATSGATYALSAWVRVRESNGPFNVALQAVPLNTWGGTLPTQTVGPAITGVTTDWVPVSGTVTLPSNATQVRVQIAATSLTATVLVDQLSLARLSP